METLQVPANMIDIRHYPPECSLPAGEDHCLWVGEDTTEDEIIGVLREATARGHALNGLT